MSLLLNILEDLESRSPGYDFGFGLHPHYLQSVAVPVRRQYDPLVALIDHLGDRQMAPRQSNRNSCAEKYPIANVGKDGFQVCMNVAHFKPSELNVKVVDNSVLIEGKHEEREDEHGYIMRHFTRRYALPPGYEAEKVASTLSSDGVLTISIPKPAPIEDKSKERIVQIQQVGPAHLNVKSNTNDTESMANGKSTNGAGEGDAENKK